MSMRLRLDLAYDGGSFHGWAKQPSLRTVQGEMEQALHTILRITGDDQTRRLSLTVAGRTDAGVHATGQVCHVDVQPEMLDRAVGHLGVGGVEALQQRLMHLLPDDLVVRRVSVAPDGFDARFSALDRTYVYRLWDDPMFIDPRMRSFVLPMTESLDLDAMNEAASMTLGLHDFGSFATPNPHGTTIRKVVQAVWRRSPACTGDVDSQGASSGGTSDILQRASSGVTHTLTQAESLCEPLGHGPSALLERGMVCFTVTADAFAHNMVRSLVHACVEVGRHRKSVAWFGYKIAHPEREGDTGPIAARGLTLEHVAYPPENELAARALAIRAKRTL